MKPATQSALILLATLILGFVVGALATGALRSHRMVRVERLRERGGFVEHMERAIEPRDQNQRSEILPILEATAERNRLIIDSAHGELRKALDAMITELEPYLDEAHLRRFRETARLTDPFRPPPPPGERGDRPPPPGQRPPPGEPPRQGERPPPPPRR